MKNSLRMKVMILRIGLISCLLSLTLNTFAANTMYCPQHSGYINVGMSIDQVVAACGQPISKQQSNTPVMQKVPVLQLMYNNEGSPTAFYGTWNLPVGNTGGAQLEVDVINNKVSGVKLNGSATNAFSICGSTLIQIGDPVGRVYGACGNPSLVNNTFINQAIQSNERPEIWIYQVDPYQPSYSLTFANGKLQSIN